MHVNQFKEINEKVRELRDMIEESLIHKIGLDFKNWILVLETNEDSKQVLDSLQELYTKKGWGIKITDECINYHDCSYVRRIYLKYVEGDF